MPELMTALGTDARRTELGRIDIGLAQLKSAIEEARRCASSPSTSVSSTLDALRDPFDRLIGAAARALDAKLVTRDRPIDDLGLVQTIWA